MHARHKALAAALALGSALAAPGLAPGRAAAQEPAAQAEPQRRPQGPAAGPVIKLPRDASVGDERAAQQSAAARDERTAEPQKWEYCAIVGFVSRQRGLGISGPQVSAAVIRYFGSGTEDVVEGSSASESEALAAAFTKLGEDGWELAGVRPDLTLDEGSKSSATYFFKRPKRRY